MELCGGPFDGRTVKENQPTIFIRDGGTQLACYQRNLAGNRYHFEGLYDEEDLSERELGNRVEVLA